jgi:hypothetical protein
MKSNYNEIDFHVQTKRKKFGKSHVDPLMLTILSLTGILFLSWIKDERDEKSFLALFSVFFSLGILQNPIEQPDLG